MQHTRESFKDVAGEIGNTIDFLCGGTFHSIHEEVFDEAANWPFDYYYGFFKRGETGITNDYAIEHLSTHARLLYEASPDSATGLILTDLVDLIEQLPVASSKAFATCVTCDCPYPSEVPPQVSEVTEPISCYANLCMNSARTLERFFKSLAISDENPSFDDILNRTIANLIRLKLDHLQNLVQSLELERQYRGITPDGKNTYRISLNWTIYKKWRKTALDMLLNQLGNILPKYQPATPCSLGKDFFAVAEQISHMTSFSIQHECQKDEHVESIFFPELDNIKTATLSSIARLDRQIQQDMWGIREASTDQVQDKIDQVMKRVGESRMQEDIKNAISCSINEIGICMKNECFIASIALTGRVFEACLKQLLAINGQSISQLKNEGINALWRMVENSRSNSISSDLHISETWLDILCYYRNMNVHDQTNRGLPPVPSENQATAALNICMDLLDRTMAATSR